MKDEFEEVNLFDEDKTPSAEEELASLEAKKEPTGDEFKVPEKFEGKSLEDVITAYTNLEKDHGRKANEVGDLRKLTDQILKQQVERDVQQSNEELGLDDFIDDPAKAVDKALDNNPRLKALEANIEREIQKGSHATLLHKHEDADTVVASPEFQDWVKTSPARQRLLQEAHVNYDAELASELLDMYKNGQVQKEDAAKAERDGKASDSFKKAAVERGGNTSGDSKKVYRRSELIKLKISNPTRYSAMADEIQLAYAEGRVK